MKKKGNRGPLAIAGGTVVALPVVGAIALAAFPVSPFKAALERRLSARFGRTVTIASLERADRFSLHPTIVLRGLVVPQPRWAGAGDLARVDRATLVLPALPLLRGRVAPSAVTLSGVRLALVRTAGGAKNWTRSTDKGGGDDGGTPIRRLTVTDTVISYRDAKQSRAVTLSVTADPSRGLRATGRGVVRGALVTLAVAAPPPGEGRWPFRASIDGPELAMTATGAMAAPLDVGHLGLHLTARASDLKMIDAIVEAGLFRTQPVRLAAHVERNSPRWHVTRLTGTIGRSTIAGHVDVEKVDGRTKLAGAIRSTRLDFDDLASDEGLAKGRALKAAIGARLVPNTRINIRKITHTDGDIDVRVDRIVGKDPSALRTLAGHLAIDHQRLTIAPLTIGLAQGAITGRMTVDQRGGVPVPLVRIDLRLADSSVPAIAGGGGGGTVTGRLDARAVLAGRGSTIREAVGASSGRIGLAARDGALPARIAAALGFDAGRALLAGHDDRAGLRCAILGLDVRGGTGRVDPLVIDTSASQLCGTGTVAFPDERLAIRLTGAPKRGSLLRLPGSATMTGTIQDPHVAVPPQVKSTGNILRAIGRAIAGDQGPTAADADCRALAARVLR